MRVLEVRLYYKLQDHAYHGSLWSRFVEVDEPAGNYDLSAFENVSFSQMMSKLAALLREKDEPARVSLHRLEIEDSEYVLDQETVEMLRTNPAAVISSMHVPDRVVHVRSDKTVKMVADERIAKSVANTEGLEHLQLRAGHDTLADAFGDFVYCRRRDNTVEDPLTGRWVNLQRPQHPVFFEEQKFATFYEGDKGKVDLLWCEAGDGWLKTSLPALLALEDVSKRLYLPRKWNESGPWISIEDLGRKYVTFCKEREKCSMQHGV